MFMWSSGPPNGTVCQLLYLEGHNKTVHQLLQPECQSATMEATKMEGVCSPKGPTQIEGIYPRRKSRFPTLNSLYLGTFLTQTPKRIQNGTIPNSGFQHPYGVDCRTPRWIYFLAPPRGLDRVGPWALTCLPPATAMALPSPEPFKDPAANEFCHL